MTENKLIELLADNLSKNSMDQMFPYIASGCEYYSSGIKRASGKKEVCEFFLTRKKALIRDKVPCYAYPAVIEKSEQPSFVKGTNCVALAQFDKYNCVGFMTIQTDALGMINLFDFHTTSNVQFKTADPDKHSIFEVPKDAHDAIGYRAIAFGVLNENVVPSRHVLRYEVFPDYVRRLYTYILRYVVDDFNTGITNAAGYMYITAMAVATKRKTGMGLFVFDEKEAPTGRVPVVDDRYQDWLNAGYETGKKLFFGFIEYANLRNPREELFCMQLQQSYMDMCLYGTIQANRDYDMGIPEI